MAGVLAWTGVALGAASLGMGYLSGRNMDRQAQKSMQAQYEADLESWEFNWQESQDAYEAALEDVAIAEYNFRQNRDHRNAQEMQQWIEKDKLRLFDYNTQVKAYNASVASYGEQLDFNLVADQLAGESAQRAYQDQLTLLGFQYEETGIGKSKAEKEIERKRKGVKQERDVSVKSLKFDKQKAKVILAEKQSQLIDDLEMKRLTGLDNMGKVRAMGRTGRSANRTLMSQKAAKLRFEEALLDSYYRAEVTTGLDIQAINAKIAALGDKADLDDQVLLDDLYNTRVQTDFVTQQLNQQLKSQNLAYEADQQKRKLDKYAADIQAKKILAPAPVLAPELAKPLEIPEPVLQKPRAPRKGPRPRKGAAVTGHGMAALASGGQALASSLISLSQG